MNTAPHRQSPSRRPSRLLAGAFALCLLPAWAGAQTITLDFAHPVTVGSQTNSFSGPITLSSSFSVTGQVVSGASIVPATNVVVTGTGTSRTVQATRLPGMFGTAEIRVVSAGATSDVFQVTFETNLPPTIVGLTNYTMSVNTAANQAFTVGDPDTPLGSLVLGATSSDTNLIDFTAGSITGTGTNRTLALAPKTNATGTATVTVTVSDGDTTATNAFVLTVRPVLTLGFSSPATNNSQSLTFTGPITFAPQTMTFSNAVLVGSSIAPSSNVVVSGTAPNQQVSVTRFPRTGGMVTVQLNGTAGTTSTSTTFQVFFETNQPPSFVGLANFSMDEDAVTNRAFVVTDPDTAASNLVLNAWSSNTNLIVVSAASISGTGTNRTINLAPLLNENGNSTIFLTVFDGETTTTNSFVLTVNPVNDPPTLTGGTGAVAFDNAPTNILPGVVVSDVDHMKPVSETLVATVEILNPFGSFSGGGLTFSTTGTPAQVTTALQNLQFTPTPNQTPPGTTNTMNYTVTVSDSGFSPSYNRSAQIISVNDSPVVTGGISPTSVVEGGTVQPFFITSIADPDVNDDLFTIRVQLVDTNQASLGSFTTPTALTNATVAEIQSFVAGIGYTAATGVITGLSEVVQFRYQVTDGHSGTRSITNSLTILAQQTAPSIFGVPIQTVNLTDAPVPYTPFPTVSVSDPDDNGNQLVGATLSSSNPALGSFSQTNFSLMSAADLTTALRAVTYTPNSGVLPVNVTSNTVLTITATDATALSAVNNNVTLAIKAVNSAPQILNVPAAGLQPVLLPPAIPIRPFADLSLSSDDTNVIVVAVSIDNPAKGSLTDLGSFVETVSGTYQMTGSVATVLASFTNLSYAISGSYLFPVDDPGGTTFTITAQDFALLTSSKTLYIQVQESPRNHLVTRALNDGLPGSFTYALATAGNNDMITFALPSYPATIRMPGTSATVVSRNVTIKGPGADLLTISGDNNGDLVPDRQIFSIASRVTIEGVTLSRGTAGYGGAVQVQTNGVLTLRRVAVVDSFAEYYGGGIDVNGGQLLAEDCFIGRNRLSDENGFSGAGVSIYSDQESRFVNTTFAQNIQANENGDGGGAMVVENRDSGTPVYVYLTHCTFAENVDASGGPSAVLSLAFGTRVRVLHSIFSDNSGRTLDVNAAGEIISLGGNLATDSTKVVLGQQGQSEDVFLLDHLTDLTNTDPLLAPLVAEGDPTSFYPLLPGSPAIGKATTSTNAVDQRGIIRTSPNDAGAVEFNALRRIVINEIDFDATTLDFIEIYAPRDSAPVDLAPYSLFVDGVKVHEFSNSLIIGTNANFEVGDAASTLLNPGFGLVVAFTDTPVSVTGDSNPTPVVRPSVTNVNLGTRSTITIGLGGSQTPVARASYLGVYLDPATGTNVLNITGNSISLAPQYRGHALVPHGLILPGPFSGVDPLRNLASNPNSIGADASGTPFGSDNADPLALPDYYTLTEDDLGVFGVLANDFDSDGNDRLVVVDISTVSDPDVGIASNSVSQLGAPINFSPTNPPLRGTLIHYDPRTTAFFQALPVGQEILDTFYYEILDIGSAAIEDFPSGTSSNTLVASTSHRLESGESIVISGSSTPTYNGTFAVTVVDDHTFSIPVTYAGPADTNGIWETSLPRPGTSRSEASVTVKVAGVNDTPVANPDTATNVTEVTVARIMTRPELVGAALSFPSDPVPNPLMLNAELLSNDDDVDSDDTWQTLRVVGVIGSVNPIAAYSGSVGATPVTVTSAGHGLSTGQEILIANYGGHPTYNGYHTVTVVDADTFTIPRFFVDDHPAKGVWVVLNDANRYSATTDVGATVTLTLRADPTEDHLIFDASASAYLKGLAEGELYTNRFYYAVADSHGALGIGTVDVEIVGVNDTPVALPDPDQLGGLDPLVGDSNTLADVLAEGLDLMYTLPGDAGDPDRVNLQVLDLSATLPATVVIADIWTTDEQTALAIDTQDLLANDSDIDRLDILTVVGVDAFSREGASLGLSAGVITYNPAVSSNLQALARDELLVDTFEVVVSDGMPNGTVTSLVAVLVVGLNDTPVARPDTIALTEDDIFSFNPIVHPAGTSTLHDVEIDINGATPDDRLSMIVVSNILTAGQAIVDISSLSAQYDAVVSELLNQLADWQTYTDSFQYTISDNSFLFAVDDEFYVPAGTTNRQLDVLANDRNFTTSPGMTIVGVGPTFSGGTVAIGDGGSHIVYSSPDSFVGDDFFRYVIENEAGDRRSGRVLVRTVVPALNGILNAADDRFTLAFGETAVLNVLANDNMLPASGAGLTISPALLATSIPGQPILTNNTFVYTATNGLTPLVFTYEVSAGGTSVAQAEVVVNIVDRRGALRIRDDAFSVMGNSISNSLEVLSNDALVTASTANLRIRAILDPAVNGAITTNAGGTALVYTPNPGYLGRETIRYEATDALGGTGTGTVEIVIGRVDTAPDFYTVAASTNGVAVELDVLANDRIMPYPAGALRLVSVSPASSTPIGLLAVKGDGSRLLFTPSNLVGQLDFDYVVEDGAVPPRTATGRVTIATVGNGTYANTDRYLVRGEGSDYELDVLANDISYPNVNKTYSILSIGTGGNAPSAGGTVSIVSNRLVYTPAPGFFGEETFTYSMTDSVSTDSALVTVSVRRGDLMANRDHYTVFYELDGGGTNAQSFTLPVVLNDRIQPPLDQIVQVVGLGVGTNAPSQGGQVSIGGDGISLVYRPVAVPGPEYTERFTYEISDGTERRASAEVFVVVRNRESVLDATTHDDAYTVSRNSANNALPVMANDAALPATAAGWTIVSVSSSTQGAAPSISGTNVLYTPPANFVGLDAFTYEVNDGLGGTGSATVQVRVGNLPTMPDRFVALRGSSSNALDLVANDVLFSAYAEEYGLHSLFDADQGGTLSISLDNQALYTPDPAYAGAYPYEERFFYRVADDVGGLVTGAVVVAVHDLATSLSTTTVTVQVQGVNDQPTITNDTAALFITDKQNALPFTGVLFTEVDQQTLEPIDIFVEIDDAAKGHLRNLGGFARTGPATYAFTNVTAAFGTSVIRTLIFEPVENRIPVPGSEAARFTISITDNKSAMVVDTNSVVTVAAENDAPIITGTVANQEAFNLLPMYPFTTVAISDVDDLGQQPLGVSVALSDATHGTLQQLGPFTLVSNGLYSALGLTPDAATAAIRLLRFHPSTNALPVGGSRTTVFTIAVNDGYAPTVQDSVTSVITMNSLQQLVAPTGTNTAFQESFGTAVDNLDDLAVLGLPLSDILGLNSGMASVIERVGSGTNSWAEALQLLPSGSTITNNRFGVSVAVDGDLIAIGAARNHFGTTTPDTDEPGAVFLFGRNVGGPDNWGLILRIASPDTGSRYEFGYSVSLDGDRLAVGAPANVTDSVRAGAVYVFERNLGGPNAWGLRMKRTPPDPVPARKFGFDVSLLGDDLAVGAPINSLIDPGTGSVYMFQRNSGGADQWGQVQKLLASDGATSNHFGTAVALTGTQLVAGAPNASPNARGAAYVFAKGVGTNVWTETQKLLPGDLQNNDLFGHAVAAHEGLMLVSAPRTAAVTVPGSTNVGRAYLYTESTPGTWTVLSQLAPPAGGDFGLFGSAVSISRYTAAIGAPLCISNTNLPGRVFMYRFRADTAPAVATPIPDQYAVLSQPFGYTIPAGTFGEADFGDALALSATFPNGAAGLAYDVGTQTVTGTPTQLGFVLVRVVATDLLGLSATNEFNVIVLDPSLDPEDPQLQWLLEHFGDAAADPANHPALWASNGDGDSATADQEYAFGGDPNVDDDPNTLMLELGEDSTGTITFRRRTNDALLSYVVECTSNLVAGPWVQVGAAILSETFAAIDDEFEEVTVVLALSEVDATKHFRVKAFY